MVYSKRRSLDPDVIQMAIGGKRTQTEYTSKNKTYTRDEIISALKKANGNRMRAAEILDVHKSTIHRWITRFKIGDIIESNGAGRPPLTLG